MSGNLQFKAGPAAYADIKQRGFAPERIGSLLGASGGAKWLVLSQIDRVLVSELLPKLVGPVHLLGSSIGAWRFACYTQPDPLARIEQFEDLYINQTYSEKPDADEITRVGMQILETLIPDEVINDIVSHPTLRLHIMTVLCRHLAASDRRPILITGLVGAISANILSRRLLGLFFSRGLFLDDRDLPPFYNAPGFPLERIRLEARNLRHAVAASGSIPLVLNGVRDIPGAPKGTYRDGGIIDYHLDLPVADQDRFALYPHFFDWLKPGWFDRQLPWRGMNPAHTERTILVCPSPEFIETLPNQKVPDRTDFVNFSATERMRIWREVVDRCQVLADELNDVLEHGQLAARLEPLGDAYKRK